MLLLVGAIGSWIAFAKGRQELIHNENELAKLRRLAGELVIEDDSLVCAVRSNYSKCGGTEWELHIPDTPPLYLYFMTRSQQLGTVKGNTTSSFESVRLQPGRRIINYSFPLSGYPRLFVDEQRVGETVFCWGARNGFDDRGLQELRSASPHRRFELVQDRLWIATQVSR